jgi:hypothetical protein
LESRCQPLGRTLYATLARRTGVTTRTVTLITAGGVITAALALTPGPYPLLLLLAIVAGMDRGNLTLLQATAVSDRWGTTHYGHLSGLLCRPRHHRQRTRTPGLLAAAAVVYAIRKTPRPTSRDRVPLKIRIRPVLSGDLGKLLGAVAAFEVGNVAATLLILRASELLAPEHGTKTATTIALGLYTAYNVSATIASVPAGRLSDRLGARGPVLVVAGGVAALALSYGLFALDTTAVAVLAVPFLLAGVGIGAVETAQHSAVAALAPEELRGSAFGLLATVQSLGNLAASGIAGILWSVASPTVAFCYLTAWMGIALTGLLLAADPPPRADALWLSEARAAASAQQVVLCACDLNAICTACDPVTENASYYLRRPGAAQPELASRVRPGGHFPRLRARRGHATLKLD